MGILQQGSTKIIKSILNIFQNECLVRTRGGNRLKVVIARYTHPEDHDQELSNGVSEDSDKEVYDSIVMDEAYNQNCKYIDPLLPG